MERQAAEPAPIPLPGPFPEAAQIALSEKLAAMIGFDFDHGRIDLTAHPFAGPVPGDVRITTRFLEDDPIGGVMATIHETGHAMYEAGLPHEWAFQPPALARGMGLHESQSLLMEMQAGAQPGVPAGARPAHAPRYSRARAKRGATTTCAASIAAFGPASSASRPTR